MIKMVVSKDDCTVTQLTCIRRDGQKNPRIKIGTRIKRECRAKQGKLKSLDNDLVLCILLSEPSFQTDRRGNIFGASHPAW